MSGAEQAKYHVSTGYSGKKGRVNSTGSSLLCRSLNSLSRLGSPCKMPTRPKLPPFAGGAEGGRHSVMEFFKTTKMCAKRAAPAGKERLRGSAAQGLPTQSSVSLPQPACSPPQSPKPRECAPARRETLAAWERHLAEFAEKARKGEEIYGCFQAYAAFAQEAEPGLAELLALGADAKTRTQLRLACFYERFLLMLAFLLELAQKYKRDALFIAKAAQLCLENQRLVRRAGEEAPAALAAALAHNNAKLERFLALQAAGDGELLGALEKVKLFAAETTLAEMHAHLLGLFRERYRRWGVLEEEHAQEYSLVLDLDETLVHCNEPGEVVLRPHLQHFLAAARPHFALHIFTSSLPEYADVILDHIEREEKVFGRRLYRADTVLLGGHSVKDLGRLGFDLAKTLIVDNTPENYQAQPENGVYIPSFYDDPADSALLDLLAVLRRLAAARPPDVREFLARYRAELIESIRRGAVVPKAN